MNVNFVWENGVGTAVKSLDAHTTYWFYILDTGTSGNSNDQYKNAGIITCSINDWVFSKDAASYCELHTGASGNYTFKIQWDGATPKVSVVYPTGNTSYTVYFERSTWNGQFTHAYIWSGTAPSETKLFGDFPGVKFWGNLTFESDVEPENIIFNDGSWDGHHETETLPFYNGTTYNESGVKPYSLTINSYGWASMYLTFPAIVPEGVTAYYASSRSASVITLEAIETGGVIPANTGVVVKGTAGETYSFAYNAGAPVSISSNLLKGVFVGTDVAVNSTYVLATGDATSCTFRKYTNASGEGNVTLGANKAYILASDVASAPMIRFSIEDENNATDVHSIDAHETAVKFINNGKLFIRKNGVVYDATGCVVR